LWWVLACFVVATVLEAICFYAPAASPLKGKEVSTSAASSSSIIVIIIIIISLWWVLACFVVATVLEATWFYAPAASPLKGKEVSNSIQNRTRDPSRHAFVREKLLGGVGHKVPNGSSHVFR
jgi:hypothetical protein